jgi:hypothetical protein
MRWLLLLLVLAGCADPYYRGYAYDERPYPRYASGYPSYYYGDYSGPSYYGGPGPYGSENCGTPYEWKACPPRRWR